MKGQDRWEALFKKTLPTPFSIAVVLTIFAFVGGVWFVGKTEGFGSAIQRVAFHWQDGLWNSSLLAFAVQMMLILVLGHILALSKPFNKLISYIIRGNVSSPRAALLVASTTMLVGWFNWGLGLIFGAILARKFGEKAWRANVPFNYPLVGAAGYTGMVIWHGGLSGSAPLKVAESGHIHELTAGMLSPTYLDQLPAFIGFDETIFSSFNLTVAFAIWIGVSGVLFALGKVRGGGLISTDEYGFEQPDLSKSTKETPNAVGAEKLDVSRIFGSTIGLFCVVVPIFNHFSSYQSTSDAFFTPNTINMLLLGSGLIAHGSVKKYLAALDKAIGGASGILIQFPLYFGILGIMKGSGMIAAFSDGLVSIASAQTFPILTFFSAALVNIFVPSGGGQWAVQGPILLRASIELHVPLSKAVLAMSYGDQVTNMLQPFWALPLLGITRIRASQLLPYTAVVFLVASVVFLVALAL